MNQYYLITDILDTVCFEAHLHAYKVEHNDAPTLHIIHHPVLTSLSPQKRSNRIFQGEVTDGDAVIPIFAFDENHRQKLQPYLDNQIPLTLRNCQISLNKSGKFQITIKSYTSIEKSNLSYQISDPKTLGSPIITLKILTTCQSMTV